MITLFVHIIIQVITMLSADIIKEKLVQDFPNSDIELQDLTGGGDHWDLKIRSPLFKDKTMVEQHQMVYKSLGAWMRKEIHALKLHTSTL